MSRLAKKLITIPKDVSVTSDLATISVNGPKGLNEVGILPFTDVEISNDGVGVKTSKKSLQSAANVGTMWSLIRNAIVGVSEGYSKVLEVEGVGFRVALDGKVLNLNVGFSHPVKLNTPDGIDVKVDKNTIIVSGINKEKVGQFAAIIRKVKKPEPYKGKGIRYRGEIIRRKAGKKVAGVGTT